MSTDAPKRERPAKRQRAVVVPMRLLRCPSCGSTNIKTTSTIASDHDFVSQWKKCRACEFTFVANFE